MEKCFFQESGVHFSNMAPMITKIFFCVIDVMEQKNLNFWPFLWNLWPFAEKKICHFSFFRRNVFFSKVHFSYIFWSFFEVMHCRMAKNGPKLMKIYFSDFSDKSRGKQIFVNFWSFLAFLRCITFMKDSNLGQNEGILA